MAQVKILVFIPVGDNCEALSWIESLININSCEIEFLLVYYGKDEKFANEFKNSRIKIIYDQSPSKFEKFHKYVSTGDIDLNKHDLFWIVDDDIRITEESAEDFFNSFNKNNLKIAQPGCLGFAMGKQIVRRDLRYKIRFTNYVDGIAPLFSKNALEKCLQTFEGCQSGRGIDHVWAALLGNPKDKIAIIDSSLMIHMNPSGSNYSRFEKTIDEQYRKIQDRYLSEVLQHYEWEQKIIHEKLLSHQNSLVGLFNPIVNRLIEIQTIGILRLAKFKVLKLKNLLARMKESYVKKNR